jgi:hypothetical protein
MSKTRKIAGVDCGPQCFAYVRDPEDPKTWFGCLRVLGDTGKTINAIKTSLARMSETKGIPDSEKQRVFDTLRGAGLAHGIYVEQRTFAARDKAPTQEPPAPAVPGTARPYTEDPDIAEAVAMADRRADAMLRSLGWE